MTDIQTMDRNKAALLIRGAIGIQRRKQIEISKKLGLNRVVFNLFLNRRLDLLPEDIQRVMEELGLKNLGAKLSTSATIDI